MPKIITSAILKALFATFIYLLISLFYKSEIIRSNVEDIAFDIANKTFLSTKETKTDSPKIHLFVYDDAYMKAKHLFNEYNQTNYGYLFPRDKIANFINQLDELTQELEPNEQPKALFIDFDFSFTSAPYGKELLQTDKELLNALLKPHTYKIFLPKVQKENFLENSSQIKKLIKSGKIAFVSVNFLKSKDDIVRRYKSTEQIADKNYTNINIALWQLIKNKKSYPFKENDIIANRIFIKEFKPPKKDDPLTQTSYWQNLKRYSVLTSLFDIPYEEYNSSIIMLGSTHSQNPDKLNTFNLFGESEISGIDIHANTLQTLLYLNSPLKTLPIYKSALIIFFTFLLLDIAINLIFNTFGYSSYKMAFIVLLVINSILLLAISLYYIQSQKLWFNWFVPLVIMQMLEILLLIKRKSTKTVFKLLKLLRR